MQAALHAEYNQSVVFSGPRLAAIAAAADQHLALTFGGPGVEGKGLALRGSFGFEVSFNDSSTCPTSSTTCWHPATVVASTRTTITLAPAASSSPGVPVRQLRYAYADAISLFTNTQPCVYNGEGLPATPNVWPVPFALEQ